MKSPSEIIAIELAARDVPCCDFVAQTMITVLRNAGYIVIRDDAIRLAQVQAREEALRELDGAPRYRPILAPKNRR